MKTTLRIFVIEFACASCSRISPVVKSPIMPIVPVAQNLSNNKSVVIYWNASKNIPAAHLAADLARYTDCRMVSMSHHNGLDLMAVLQTNQELCGISAIRLLLLHNSRRILHESLNDFSCCLARNAPVAEGDLVYLLVRMLDQPVPHLIAMSAVRQHAFNSLFLPDRFYT